MEDDSEVRQSLLGVRRATPNRSQEGRSEMETVDFDEVLSKVGGFGRYQKTFYFLLCLPAMFTATITLANTFITAEPQTRCDIPFCDDKYMPQYDDAFVAPHHFANYTIPLSEDGTHFSTCKYYKPVMNLTKESFILSRSEKISSTTTSSLTSPRIYQCNASNFNQSVERYCTKYVYDKSIYTSTVVSEWNLVCNDSWKVPLIESMYFAGVMVGAPVFGVLADMYGRKPILMISIAMTTLFGIPLGFSPNYNIFIVLQFFVAIGQMGIFQTCFIMAIELVTKEKRVFCGIAIEYFFDIGAVFLAGIAYALRDWKYILLTATCPVGLFLMYWPIVPESVRWLLVNKKFTEAKIEIHRISKWNGRPFDVSSLGRQRGSTRSTNIPSIPTNQIPVGHLNNTDSAYENNESESIDSSRITFRPENNITSRQGSNGNNNAVMRTHEKETFITFLRDPVMFIRHVNVCYCWFVVTLVYYGLSMNSGNLAPGDPYMNFFLSSIVEIPGYTLGYFGMEKLGRRMTVCITLIISGIALLTDALLSHYTSLENSSIQYANIATFLIGKLGITATFGAIYLYTSELLPTSVRTAALGTSSMCGRIGAIVSPYIASLKIYGMWIPLIIFGVNALFSGFLILFLPDTLGHELPETIKDALKLGKEAITVTSTEEQREDDRRGTDQSPRLPQINNEEESDDDGGSLSEFEDDEAVINCDDRGPLVSSGDILSGTSYKQNMN